MSLVHDLIKIKYVREGYLPNYPYHLISDQEMCDAFINNELNYFDDNYPCLDTSIQDEYNELKSCIQYHISRLNNPLESVELPDWVCSYMLGQVISINSDTLDKHDLLVSLSLDNIDDIFTVAASKSCLQISKEWIKRLNPTKRDHRPPTMFGEPHVIKSIRMNSIDVIGGAT